MNQAATSSMADVIRIAASVMSRAEVPETVVLHKPKLALQRQQLADASGQGEGWTGESGALSSADPGASSEEGQVSISFGRFVLVPARQLLLENGVRVRIGGRAFDILSVLASRPGEVVDKAALMAKVWGRTVVEEGNLKVNMVALRRVLGERSDAPSYIATINGRGYKFIASVRVADSARLPQRRMTTRLGNATSSAFEAEAAASLTADGATTAS